MHKRQGEAASIQHLASKRLLRKRQATSAYIRPSKRSPAPIGKDAIRPDASASCVAEASGQALGTSWTTDYTVTMTNWGEVAHQCGQGLLDNLHGDCKGSIVTNWVCDIDPSGAAVAKWRMPKVNVQNGVERAIYHASWNKVENTRCTDVEPIGGALDSAVGGACLVAGTAGGAGKAASAACEGLQSATGGER